MSETVIDVIPADAKTQEDLDRQLNTAKRVSSQKLAGNLEKTQSAFILQESGHPDSFCSETISWYNEWLRMFQTGMCISITVCIFFAPYMFFFKADQSMYNFASVIDILYDFVMLLRSRTGHMIDGVEERNLLKVRERYQTSIWFYLDLATVLPLEQLRWLVPGSDEVFYAIGRQRTYLRLHYILYYLGIREEEPGSSTLIYRTTKYALLSSMTVHFLACGWYGLACSRADESGFDLTLCGGNSWIMFLPQQILQKVLEATTNREETLNGEVSFLHNTYVTSMYWASATATSTGYGDVHAYTVAEKFYSVFAMIIGMMILYGMTMGGMTSMLTNIDARRSSFVQRYTAFREEVDRMGISDNVKDLCLRYFDYLWHRWEGEDVQESGVLELLPLSLKASFAEATFHNLIRKADLLDKTRDEFCRNLSQVSQSMVYLEKQFVQRSGEIANNMCFLRNGILEVLDADEQEVVALMQSGKLFGQILLVFDLPRVNSIRCKTNCDIFLINKHDFRVILSEYPDAAKAFVEAAQAKCGINGTWPFEPPRFEDFKVFMEKTTKSKRRNSVVSAAAIKSDKVEASAPDKMAQISRRMTTVYSTDYEGVDLSRIHMHQKQKNEDLERMLDSNEPKPSLIDFVINGKPGNVGKRSSTTLADGTKMIVANAHAEDLKDAVGVNAAFSDPDETTLRDRLFQMTIINPKHRFSLFWNNFMFFVGIICGLYTTFMAFFTTVPGKAHTFSGAEAEELDIATIATYTTCNSALLSTYKQCRNDAFGVTADCIMNASGAFSEMISSGPNNSYTVTVPASYDISYVGYNPGSLEGVIHIILSYFVIDLILYLNIFINFRTEVNTPNGFLTSFKDIASNYMTWNKFYLDIIGVFPFEIIAPFIGCSRLAPHHALIFLRLNRVINFFRFVPTSFSRWEYSLNVKIVQIRTLKFIVYIYTFTHMCASVFFWWSCGYAMQSSLDSVMYKCRFGSWAWVFDVEYETNRAQDYIKTMYWASTTMTSTGYGDISASTTSGRVFALVTMVIGTVMYGWLVAVIASTVSNSEAAIVSFTNSMRATKSYLTVHAVPYGLIKRVMNVRLLEWERYQGTATPGVQTIGQELTSQLHSVLLYEAVNKFIEGLPFFHGVEPSFISMLCNHAMMFHYAEGDIIIYEGDLSRNLYIIKQGHCDVVTADLTEIVDHLSPGDYFGEAEILFGCGSPRTVVADTACEVIVVTRGDIDEVLQSFPVLEAQMENIENDKNYMEKILNAIKRRNENSRMGVTMTNRYKVTEIEGGTKLYSGRINRKPLVIQHTDTDGNDSVKSSLSFLLLPFTFDPLSRPYIAYEFVRLLLIVVTLVIVPLQMAMLPCSTALLTIQYLLDFLCCVDQYIKAHTSYYDSRSVKVTHPIQTAKHYLRTSFAVDLLCWLPIELVVYGILSGSPMSKQQWQFVGVFRLMRLLLLSKVINFMSFFLGDIRKPRRWLTHLSSALYALLIHHWCACFVFFAASPAEVFNNNAIYESDPMMVQFNATGSISFIHNSSWIGNLGANSVFPALDVIQSVTDQYIVSLYWATATLVCVGYGDIHAFMQTEMFFAIVVMISGTIYYSSILGDISANIQTDDMRRGHYKGRLSDILKFFKVYDVNKETQRQGSAIRYHTFTAAICERAYVVANCQVPYSQVLNYYCYLWDRTQGVSPDYLLVGLPPSIRTSVCQSMYDPMIREAFGHGQEIDRETEGFFRLLSTHIQPSLYLKQSIICRRNDIGDEMFFIQRGNIAIMEEDDETVATVLGPGQHFGEVALLLATARSRTIKAITNCDLNVLSKKDLDDILEIFPRFRESMTKIAQDRNVKGTRSLTYTQTPSQAALNSGNLYSQDGKRRDGSDRQKFTKVMDRESNFSYAWSHISVVLAFFSASAAIYQACFFNHYSTLYVVGYIIDVWFALDMIMSFHTSFLDQFSTNVDDQNKIHTRYAKTPSLFLLDSVSNAPLDLLAHMISGNSAAKLAVLSYARLNRVLRMYRVVCVFRVWENDIKKETLSFRLYKFVLCVCFIINSLGSVWYAIACPNSVCHEQSWATASITDYVNKQIFGYHITPWADSLYWTVATMTSTGYGDIKPENQLEMIYACLAMVTGKLTIGYVLGMVAATLANDESLRVWYEQGVIAVRRYMVDLKFKKELFDHVIQYYDYMWMKSQGADVMKLFPDLSFSLRADIYTQICRSMVDSLELFKDCPDNFMRHICMVMKPTAYMPGDYICLQGDIRSEMYIMHHGISEAMKRLDSGKTVPVRLVLEGENFLCESVLCKVKRPVSLRARTYVDVFSMTMEDLQQVLNYYPSVRPIVLANARTLFPDLQL